MGASFVKVQSIRTPAQPFACLRSLSKACNRQGSLNRRTSGQVGFQGGSIVGSTDWMVLHRPVELARQTGQVRASRRSVAEREREDPWRLLIDFAEIKWSIRRTERPVHFVN